LFLASRDRFRPSYQTVTSTCTWVALAMSRLEARGRGVVLLHDIHRATADALPDILKELKQKGFHVVHVVPSSVNQF
jgi:peptidoglycan/xylan/chitin deacetylase (PgdA/CDA1 family)